MKNCIAIFLELRLIIGVNFFQIVRRLTTCVYKETNTRLTVTVTQQKICRQLYGCPDLTMMFWRWNEGTHNMLPLMRISGEFLCHFILASALSLLHNCRVLLLTTICQSSLVCKVPVASGTRQSAGRLQSTSVSRFGQSMDKPNFAQSEIGTGYFCTVRTSRVCMCVSTKYF